MIDSFSKFYYGHTITRDNRFLNIDEGSGEISVEIATGSYTLTEFAIAVQAALNQFGGLTYSVSVNRQTRIITVAANGNFDLLIATGSQSGQSAFSLLGFTGVDQAGGASYLGSLGSGSVYYPQFKLQSYVDASYNEQSVSVVLNKTADGGVEVVTFGRESFFEMDIKFITNLPMDGFVIKNNPTGLADAIAFMRDITQKRRFEFMPDVDDSEDFYKIILENSPGFNDGTGFKLKELWDSNLRDIYETGVLKMRVIE